MAFRNHRAKIRNYRNSGKMFGQAFNPSGITDADLELREQKAKNEGKKMEGRNEMSGNELAKGKEVLDKLRPALKACLGFRICNNKGFHITFANGVTLSTQFGGGNYCGNYNDEIEAHPKPKSCESAEVAVWHGNGDWCTKEAFKNAKLKSPGDDVAGYITPGDWLKLANACAQMRPSHRQRAVEREKR